jgi:hypothetical protein
MWWRLLKYRRFLDNSLFVVLLTVFCLWVVSCGPSHEETEAQRQAVRAATRHNEEQVESELLKQIAAKFDPVFFPEKGVAGQVFTYELQRFFQMYMGQVILFKGYIEDVEETAHGFLVEFACPLGRDVLDDKSIVSFHLKADRKQAEVLLHKPRSSFFYRKIRFFGKPDYFVVSKINHISRVCRYEFRGAARGEEEIELSVETPPRFVALGELIEAISPPKEANETQATEQRPFR